MSRLLTCIIVDDEPPAIRLLEKYVDKVSHLKLKQTFSNSLEALNYLEQNTIDLVFLDIQMPGLTGIQLSKVIKGKSKVVFTTAYPQFALESYELNSVDYLLKPFTFERFYAAVTKVSGAQETQTVQLIDKGYLFVKTDGKNNLEKVFVSDILYIESLKNYVAIHLLDKQIITYATLKHLKESLPEKDFIKIHKSFIVSFQHISKTTSISVFVNDQELPLGLTYKNEFFKKINENTL